MFTRIFKLLGLTERDAAVYDFLLHYGPQRAIDVADRFALKRPTAYKTLDDLVAAGLAERDESENILRYRPVPPDRVLELVDDTFDRQKRDRSQFQAILPGLTDIYHMRVARPVVTTYTGPEGIRAIFEDTLAVGQPVDALLTPNTYPELRDWLDTYYVPRRIKLGIYARVIVSTQKDFRIYTRKDRDSFRETRSVSASVYPIEQEVNIYGTKVAFLNYKAGEPIIGIIIDHPQIAATARTWFTLAWEGARSVRPQRSRKPVSGQ